MLGIGKNIGGRIMMAGLGALAFFGSFFVLYWNEGRSDLSHLAEEAVQVSPDTVSTDAELQSQLVSVTGKVESNSLVSDDLFLAHKDYLLVRRNVEMFAWDEDKDEGNGDYNDTSNDTYRYNKVWTENPADDATFAYAEGHENPVLGFKGATTQAADFTVGAYRVNGAVELPAADELTLTDDAVSLSQGAKIGSQEYLFLGQGSLSSPEIGDVRVSYEVVKPGFTGTVLGGLSGDEIVRYTSRHNEKLWRVFKGSLADAVAQLHNEYVTTSWVIRAVGFFMMWFGLASMLGIFSIFLDLIPLLGRAARSLIVIATFPVALILTVVTILLSMILHSLLAILIIGALVLAGSAFYLHYKSSQAKSATSTHA